jgi:hypothetical protein
MSKIQTGGLVEGGSLPPHKQIPIPPSARQTGPGQASPRSGPPVIIRDPQYVI